MQKKIRPGQTRNASLNPDPYFCKLPCLLGGDGAILDRGMAMCSEIRDFITSQFAGQRFFSIAYGSFAYGLAGPGSDLDFVTVCRFFDSAKLRAAVDFTVNLHQRHGVPIDNEVPFERKLLMTLNQMEMALHGDGFDKSSGAISVPPIVKTKEFLASESMSLRLLLNSLTGGSVLLAGDGGLYESVVESARENLVGLMFCISGRSRLTPESFIDLIIGGPGGDGEFYLGYRDVPAVRSYLLNAFSITFASMELKGTLDSYGGGYSVRDHAWLSSFFTARPTVSSIIDLSNNINPFGPPAGVAPKLSLSREAITEYPDEDVHAPRKYVSGFFGIPEENIKIFSGSTEFFYLFPPAFGIKKGLVFNPSFWFAYHGLQRAGADVSTISLDGGSDFNIDFKSLRKALKENHKPGTVMCFCNPNSPTGNFYSGARLLNLVKSFPDILFVIDETYLLFSDSFERHTLSKKVTESDNLIVVSSLSKFFGIPGVRLGSVFASKSIIDRLDGASIPFRISHLSLNVLEDLFSDLDFIKNSRTILRKERLRVFRRLKKIPGLRVYPSKANFILCRIDRPGMASSDIQKFMKENGVLIRDCNDYGGLDSRFFRISIKKPEMNDIMLGLLERLFSN